MCMKPGVLNPGLSYAKARLAHPTLQNKLKDRFLNNPTPLFVYYSLSIKTTWMTLCRFSYNLGFETYTHDFIHFTRQITLTDSEFGKIGAKFEKVELFTYYWDKNGSPKALSLKMDHAILIPAIMALGESMDDVGEGHHVTLTKRSWGTSWTYLDTYRMLRCDRNLLRMVLDKFRVGCLYTGVGLVSLLLFYAIRVSKLRIH